VLIWVKHARCLGHYQKTKSMNHRYRRIWDTN
jgi:hypothetical protein